MTPSCFIPSLLFFFVFIAWKCWEVILTDLKIALFTTGTQTLGKLDGNFYLLIKYFFFIDHLQMTMNFLNLLREV